MSETGDPRRTLLADLDGDGFADALAGSAWIDRRDVDTGVAAAADLVGVLASNALRLRTNPRLWAPPRPALFFGAQPPAAPFPRTSSGIARDVERALPAGSCVVLSGSGLLVTADDGPALRAAARALAIGWAPTSRGAPPGPAADASGRTALSLGRALTGGGLYTGTPAFPERFTGGFHARAGVPEALEVAARLATVGLDPAVPRDVDPAAAGVRIGLDRSLAPGTWALRVVRDGAVEGLELVGADEAAAADGCRFLAGTFPRLPGGTSLDELEADLGRFLRLETRDGRLAAAAVLGPGRMRAYALPYPGSDAPTLLGAPVHNSARDGDLRTWSHRAAWEGDRLLEAVAALPLPEGPFELEVYASETLSVRRELHTRIAAALASAGRTPERVRVRHAYKPALHWLVEEIAPALPAEATVLEVRVGRQEERYGVGERWLRELHPVAELLERARPGLEVHLHLEATAGPPRYQARAIGAHGGELLRADLAPPVVPSPRPAGEPALSTTAGVRVIAGGRVHGETLVTSDREEAWSFLVREVFPALAREAEGRTAPFLHEISVVVQLSEPDDRLDLDHETDSVLEGLHEDIYFGLLEAYAAVRPDHGPRHLAPARILPLCRANPGGPTLVRVRARAPGSAAVTAWPAEGAPLHARGIDTDVRCVELTGRGRTPGALVVDLVGGEGDPKAALERLAWAAEVGLSPLPGGLNVTLRADGHARRLPRGPRDVDGRTGPVPALPARPLHPHEVARHARRVAARHPGVHLRLAHESVLGQSLVALETGYPATPDVSRARRARWKPTVLVSARQHANEPTSTQAVLALLEGELERPDLMRGCNLVVHPLENPDGARLHAALCSLEPNHMHHAARYTAFGADLQTDPVLHGRLIGESALRRDAWRRWRPLVHLNNHGYPAHEWVRPQTGYVPAGFANWSLPVGHLTIVTLRHAPSAPAEALVAALRERVAEALAAEPTVAEPTRRQIARSARYRPLSSTPFHFARGLPFWETVAAPAEVDTGTFAPALTVITEVPDETVDGERWDACVLAHRRIDEAVLRALGEALGQAPAAGAEQPRSSEPRTLAPFLAWAARAS